jgi:hypothetical protein
VQNKKIWDKTRKTCIKTYGVDFPMKDPGVRKKAAVSRTKIHHLYCNGKAYACQGYERFVLPRLVERYGTEDVIGQFEPGFKTLLFVSSSGKRMSYRPDIYIRSKNTYIEVKSPYFLFGSPKGADQMTRNRLLQHQANKLGINLRFVVYDESSKRFTLLPKDWLSLSNRTIVEIVKGRVK